jgi:hypothetical protein
MGFFDVPEASPVAGRLSRMRLTVFFFNRFHMYGNELTTPPRGRMLGT